MTNTSTAGAHRPETTGLRPATGLGRPQHHRGGGTPLAGQIQAQSWRDQAESIRADLEAKAILRSLRARGAGA